MDPYIGEIRLVAFNFAPVGWAFCNGQLLPIAQNSALFSLLGTFYGGDGRVTFGLPNLQSRAAVGMGQGQGLSPYVIGQMGGVESVNLNTSNLPVHSHGFAIQASHSAATTGDPTNAYPGLTSDGSGGQIPIYAATKTTVTMAPQNTSPAGGGQPFSNVQPCIALNYIIALQGVYPSRS